MPSWAVTPRMQDTYTTTTRYKEFSTFATTLQSRHNGCDGVLNHQCLDCLLNLLIRHRSKKLSKLRVTGLCAGSSPGAGGFPTQMASYAENDSIWWRHHAYLEISAQQAAVEAMDKLFYSMWFYGIQLIIHDPDITFISPTVLRMNATISFVGARYGAIFYCSKVRYMFYSADVKLTLFTPCCPACRTTLVATRFRVAAICPIIQVPHCIRVFFYFVWFVFINHIFQFYYELCTYCNILDIYLS